MISFLPWLCSAVASALMKDDICIFIAGCTASRSMSMPAKPLAVVRLTRLVTAVARLLALARKLLLIDGSKPP